MCLKCWIGHYSQKIREMYLMECSNATRYIWRIVVHIRGEKISVRSSNHWCHLIPSKEMTNEEAMQNFRAIGEVLYVPKCLWSCKYGEISLPTFGRHLQALNVISGRSTTSSPKPNFFLVNNFSSLNFLYFLNKVCHIISVLWLVVYFTINVLVMSEGNTNLC